MARVDGGRPPGSNGQGAQAQGIAKPPMPVAWGLDKERLTTPEGMEADWFRLAFDTPVVSGVLWFDKDSATVLRDKLTSIISGLQLPS